jgi:uncharacterized protein (DUF4415 family)
MKRPLRNRRPSQGRADLARLRRMSDAEIERTAPVELPLFPDDFWEGASVQFPSPKTAISLRVDEEVLAYQTRMNAVLRGYVSHMRRQGKKTRRPSKRLQRPGVRRKLSKRAPPPRSRATSGSKSRRAARR